MAQLVEQRIRNAWVTGSSPVFGSTFHSPPLLVEDKGNQEGKGAKTISVFALFFGEVKGDKEDKGDKDNSCIVVTNNFRERRIFLLTNFICLYLL